MKQFFSKLKKFFLKLPHVIPSESRRMSGEVEGSRTVSPLSICWGLDIMRRSATSITSNIAEGFGRQTYREKVQFYYLAQGSLIELKNQILIAKDVKYLDKNDFQQLVEQANLGHQLLQGLIKKSKTFIIHKS